MSDTVLEMANGLFASYKAANGMGAGAALAFQLAKLTLTGAVSGGLVWSGLAFGSQILFGLYGGRIASVLVDTVHTEIGKRMRGSSSKREETMAPETWNQWAKEGASRAPAAIVAGISQNSTAFMLAVLAVALQYLHGLGAYEMRRRVRETDGGGHPDATAALDDDTRRAYMEWMSKTEQKSDDDGLLDGMLRRMYTAHPFYATPQDPSKEEPYFTLGENHPVRVVINLILGFSMQVNALFTGQSGHSTADPIYLTARRVSLLTYWEVIARALRLYGVAPVFVATSMVARMFSQKARRAPRR